MAKKDEAVLLTKEGLKKMKDELKHLKETGRQEVAQKIKEASEFGDLSENSEYDEAKNEQALMEARIIELEQVIKNAKIIDDSKVKSDEVTIGSTVTLKNKKDDIEGVYTIVGAIESDPLNGMISNESPVGKAILGSKKGDTVAVKSPSGMIDYAILKVAHSK